MPTFPLDRVRGHELLPDSVAGGLPALYANEGESDPVALVKFFCPYSAAVWYITEYSPAEDLAFGWADLGFDCGELGYISVEELATAEKRGLPLIERDLYWSPRPLSEAIKG